MKDIEERLNGKSSREILKELDREDQRNEIREMIARTAADWAAVKAAKRKADTLRAFFRRFTGRGMERAIKPEDE